MPSERASSARTLEVIYEAAGRSIYSSRGWDTYSRPVDGGARNPWVMPRCGALTEFPSIGANDSRLRFRLHQCGKLQRNLQRPAWAIPKQVALPWATSDSLRVATRTTSKSGHPCFTSCRAIRLVDSLLPNLRKTRIRVGDLDLSWSPLVRVRHP